MKNNIYPHRVGKVFVIYLTPMTRYFTLKVILTDFYLFIYLFICLLFISITVEHKTTFSIFCLLSVCFSTLNSACMSIC